MNYIIFNGYCQRDDSEGFKIGRKKIEPKTKKMYFGHFILFCHSSFKFDQLLIPT